MNSKIGRQDRRYKAILFLAILILSVMALIAIKNIISPHLLFHFPEDLLVIRSKTVLISMVLFTSLAGLGLTYLFYGHQIRYAEKAESTKWAKAGVILAKIFLAVSFANFTISLCSLFLLRR